MILHFYATQLYKYSSFMHCMQAQLPKKRFAKSLAVLQKNLQFDKTYFGKLATDLRKKTSKIARGFGCVNP